MMSDGEVPYSAVNLIQDPDGDWTHTVIDDQGVLSHAGLSFSPEGALDYAVLSSDDIPSVCRLGAGSTTPTCQPVTGAAVSALSAETGQTRLSAWDSETGRWGEQIISW